ncbi:YjbE family putative metal transport protein [Alicyclobacillus shizuokensis]|uniref:YjbE family putative metal transport protein n=1 Tax=Alicyclobacillus shizuokensis TaxID=392014 RepID=UPI0008341300|nr:YjbE family putative metal transport protein [Alicyclobacillus shizuokensis]
MNWYLLVLNVVLVNIILSGDNALAISLAADRLPPTMRKRAIVLGSILAIVLLIGFTALGTFIIQIPVLKSAAGALLMWIALRLATERLHKPRDDSRETRSAVPNRLWKAIGTIAVADLCMELDNAMAMLGAAHGRLSVLLAGFLCTIPFLILGSQVIAKVFDKLPWIVFPAAGYIAWIAGNMIADDAVYAHLSWNPMLQRWLPLFCMLVFACIIAISAWRGRRSKRRFQAALQKSHPLDRLAK